MALSTHRASASLLSSESPPRWKYDVFLSFRGADTRKGFVSHLYHELQRHGITTFFDDRELEGGASIPLGLPCAIKESHTAVVVLSPNYASSKWCLDELTNIVQCMKATNSILPVFYGVNPSDVGNQRGSFAEAFAEHDKKLISTEDKTKVIQWKADLKLVSKLYGWHLRNFKCERELIEDIVKCVWRKVQAPFTISDCSQRAIEAISLRLPQPKIEEVRQWNCETFSKMHGLRFLEFDNLIISSCPKFLPCSLRVMHWSWYPSKFLPTSFHPCFLTELKMPSSKIVRLWEGKKDMPNLKYIDLTFSYKLMSTPDFSGLPNLEKLYLWGCKNLVEIHPSVAVLKRLKVLCLHGCERIKRLPSKVEIDSLESFDLSYCSNVKKIPDFGEHMKNLSQLYVVGTAIETIPSSIEHLVGLAELDLRSCKNLLNLPSSICNLKSLRCLNVNRCSKLDQFPGDMEYLKRLYLGITMREPLVGMKNLEYLEVDGAESNARSREGWGLLRLLGLGKSRPDPPCWGLLLSSLSGLCSLIELDLRDCNLCEGDIPDDIGCLSVLKKLYISGNNFVSLPESIRGLSKLQRLRLERCKSLQVLPHLPSNIKLHVDADNCTSLKRLCDPSKLSSCFANLYDFTFSSVNCITLVQDEGWINTILSRILKFAAEGPCPSYDKKFTQIVSPGSEIPEWFSNQSVGHSVNVELPPPSCNNWLGIAFCVVFEDPKQNLANSAALICPSTLRQYDEFQIGVLPCFPNVTSRRCKVGSLVSEHLWVFYLPSKLCQAEQISFTTFYDYEREPGLNVVKKCGACLVYEQDLGELTRTLKILKRTHEYCDEAAPSGLESGSFDHIEQIHKRQKEG
ncbi:unnamed protein product [Malus baccata var. baccata]